MGRRAAFDKIGSELTCGDAELVLDTPQPEGRLLPRPLVQFATAEIVRKGPLHLLIYSTGIKVEGEGEWHARRHGGAKRRVWRKIHLGTDEETLQIRAVEITGSHVGDAPILPDLLDQIPEGQEIGSVTADGAYDTRKCHDAIADRGA